MPRTNEPPRVALIGAGNRGRIYTDWILTHRDAMTLAAVAEPNQIRRETVRSRHDIRPARAFEHWRSLFAELPQGALDGVIIATGDREHVEPAVAALSRGLHVLLEKPMAVSLEGLARLRTHAATGGSLTVCHVLRYTTLFRSIKECIDAGEIGDVLTIFHAENVSYYHMAHSFVRGNWRNSETSSPMILAKSCHDLDLICWYAASEPVWVASTAARSFFTEERAPAGAPERCVHGCPVAATCPYEAVRTYHDGVPVKQAVARTRGPLAAAARFMLRAPGLAGSLPGLRRYRVWREWPTSTITDELTSEGIIHALHTGPYGRCVYRCDNDQPDHQETVIRFASGATATFRMHGRSHEEGRTLRIDGTRGTIRARFAAQRALEVHRHGEIKARTIPVGSQSVGHADADAALMAAWSTVFSGHTLETSAHASLRSHRLALAADRSARTGTALDLTDPAIHPVQAHEPPRPRA